MYDDVLLPTDGSEAATAALDYAIGIADAHDATVHVLYVADTTADSLTTVKGTVVDALEREGDRIVNEATDRARARRASVVGEVRQGRVHEAILSYTSAAEIDLVVMATHGRGGFERFLLGSVTERIVRASPVPVLTLRPDGDPPAAYPPTAVLCPVDGSRCSGAALEQAVHVAADAGATLHLLHVVDTASLGIDVASVIETEALEERGAEIVEEAAATARSAPLDTVVESVGFGSIHREIRTYLDEHGVDLVVLGTHGRTGLSRHLIGSVAGKLVRASPVPVMTVRDPESASRAADDQS